MSGELVRPGTRLHQRHLSTPRRSYPDLKSLRNPVDYLSVLKT